MVRLSLKEADVDQALAEILKDGQYTYRIKGYHIILSPGKYAGRQKETNRFVQSIRGVVTDSKSNTPIEYATVSILGKLSWGLLPIVWAASI